MYQYVNLLGGMGGIGFTAFLFEMGDSAWQKGLPYNAK